MTDFPPELDPSQEGGSWTRIDSLFDWPLPPQEGGSWTRIDSLLDWPSGFGVYRDGRFHVT